jgi:hypothetical protein
MIDKLRFRDIFGYVYSRFLIKFGYVYEDKYCDADRVGLSNGTIKLFVFIERGYRHMRFEMFSSVLPGLQNVTMEDTLISSGCDPKMISEWIYIDNKEVLLAELIRRFELLLTCCPGLLEGSNITYLEPASQYLVAYHKEKNEKIELFSRDPEQLAQYLRDRANDSIKKLLLFDASWCLRTMRSNHIVFNDEDFAMEKLILSANEALLR